MRAKEGGKVAHMEVCTQTHKLSSYSMSKINPNPLAMHRSQVGYKGSNYIQVKK